MTPKEKAVLLVASMSFSKAKVADYVTGEMVDIPGNIFAKQCALIAVDEILNDYEEFPYKIQLGKDYWQEVKQELEKL
jgi:hypothetical protein